MYEYSTLTEIRSVVITTWNWQNSVVESSTIRVGITQDALAALVTKPFYCDAIVLYQYKLFFHSDSSSDEKLPESEDTAATDLQMKNDEKPEDVDSADDALSDLGFVDSFVPTKPLPPKHPPTNPFAQTDGPPMPSKPTATNAFGQSVDPFSDFDSVIPNVDQNDPFTRVITRLPEQPAPIHQVPGSTSEQAPSEIPPSGLRPSTNSVSLTPSHQTPVNRNSFSPPNNQGPLIDLGGELESPSSTDPRSSSSTSGVMSDDLLFSSGSHSSNESGKRFSSSASSSSDSGVKTSAKIPPIKKEQNAHSNKKGIQHDL
jgi:hypothetical protein